MAKVTGHGTANIKELLADKPGMEFAYICYNADKPSRIINGKGEEINLTELSRIIGKR